jgi:purine-binding chemotaxis protein CheW
MAAASAKKDNGDGGGRMLSVRIGDQRLALSAAEVVEILRRPRLTRVPQAPASLSGMANLRGAAVPILSLARLLGQEDDGASAKARIVVLDRRPALGLAVDEIMALAETGSHADGLAGGSPLLLDGDGAHRLIDLDQLLAREFSFFRRRAAEAPLSTAAPAPVQPAARAVTLLGIELAGQDYALPVEAVVEILALPPDILGLPSAAEAAIGIVAYRDGLLPLASLRVLLGLPASAGAGRTVVVRIGTALVGLVVDRIRGLLHAPEAAIGPVPAVLNRGAGEARIGAIYRAAAGGRLISILSPEHLFRDETTARILADGRQREDVIMAEQAQAGSERFVVFRLGEEAYGLPIAAVEEVARLPETVTRVPRAPDFVDGVMNLRGRIVPLIDLRRRFEAEGEQRRGRRRVVVTRLRGVLAGFIVDAVSEIADLAPDRLVAAPDFPAAGDGSTEAAALFDRIAPGEDDRRMVLLVDPQALLDRVEAELLQAMERAEPGAS